MDHAHYDLLVLVCELVYQRRQALVIWEEQALESSQGIQSIRVYLNVPNDHCKFCLDGLYLKSKLGEVSIY